MVGYATLQVNPLTGAPHDEACRPYAPDVPHHASLVRLTDTLVEFDSGTLNREQVCPIGTPAHAEEPDVPQGQIAGSRSGKVHVPSRISGRGRYIRTVEFQPSSRGSAFTSSTVPPNVMVIEPSGFLVPATLLTLSASRPLAWRNPSAP